MEFYEPAELQQVLRRSAALLGVELSEDGSAEIAGRSRGTPRIANRLLRRVRDYAEVEADGRVTREVAQAALALYDVDVLGLDRLDRAVLEALVVRFGGGPVGVATLAVAVGEEPNTVEEVCEPFLVRAGLLARTPAGPGGHRGGLAPPRAPAAEGWRPAGWTSRWRSEWSVRWGQRRTGDPGCVVRAAVRRIDSLPLARNSSGRGRARPVRSPARAARDSN